MTHVLDSSCIIASENADTPEVLKSMAKLGYALHATPTANDTTSDTMDISETTGMNMIPRIAKTFWEYKQFVCTRFARGVEILKDKAALLDHYGVVMVLTALASGKSWDDADRVDGEVFGLNTNCDTFGALAENMVAGCNCKTHTSHGEITVTFV